MQKFLLLTFILGILGCGKTSINIADLGGGGGSINVAPVANIDRIYLDMNDPLQTISVMANDTDPDGDSISLTVVGASALGTIAQNGNQIDYTPNPATSGVDTINYTITDSQGNDDVGTLYVYIVTAFDWWGGGADSNWDTPGNWCASATAGKDGCVGGSGPGDVPGSMDTALFHSGCTQCNANINLNLTLGNLITTSDYSGTITQDPGQTITIDDTSLAFAGGTFQGGNSQILLDSSTTFYLTGGVFNSTTATLRLDNDLSFTGGTFGHNNGLVLINDWNSHANLTISNSAIFNDVTITKGGGAGTYLTGTMDIDGTMTLNSTASLGLAAGTYRVSGNIVATDMTSGSAIIILDGNSPQTITGLSAGALPSVEIASTSTVTLSGNVAISRDLTYTSGSVITTGSTVEFVHGVFCCSATVTPGNIIFNNVLISKTGGSNLDLVGTMDINGDLTLNQAGGGSGALNSGTVLLAGDLNSTDHAGGGTATIRLDGSAPQTITGTTSSNLPHLEFASTSTITLIGDINITRNLTYTSGTIIPGTSIMSFVSNTHGTIDFGGQALYDVNLNKTGGANVTLNSVLDVSNDLNINVGGNAVLGSTIEIGGNLTVTTGSGGTTALILNGTAQQDINHLGGNFPTGGIIFNNANNFRLLSATDLGGQDIDVVNGDIDMNGFNLIGINDISTYTGTITKNAGLLDYVTCTAGGCPADDL